jgi:hypothetical protein
MSLARLLTAAKALTTFNESPTAYRVRRAALLPKFSGTGDPFASGKKTEPAGVAAQSATPAIASGSARTSIWPWKLPSRRNNRSSDVRPPFQPNAGSARAARTPVQGELSLEKVKVIRNDLRESDVDVVARAGGTETSRPPMASSLMLGAMAAEKALDRLADRIVGAETR